VTPNNREGHHGEQRACLHPPLMKEAEERQHLASKPAGTAKELPDDGQVHERFLMDRPALPQFENGR
jgi:hypothetical protein